MNRILGFVVALRRFLRLSWEAILLRESDCLRRAETAHKDATETLIKVIRGEHTRGVAGEESGPVISRRARRRIGGPVGAD